MTMEALTVDEVKRRARRGPLLLLIRRLTTLLISLVSTVTIARLLSPREFGLAAMSLVIFSFSQMFRDFGLSNAVLRKGSIDQDELSFLFWCNLAMTLMLSAITALCAGEIAVFYREPQVKAIVLVSLISFVIGGISLQHGAILKRNLRFEASAMIEVASALTGFIVGLSLAYLLRNVWAIVASNIAQSVMASILNIAWTRWRPSRPKWRADAMELFRFAGNTSAFTFVNFFSRNTGTLVIGHLLDVATLGFYNRANALFQIPINNLVQPIAQTTLPVLTRFRHDPDLYRAAYLQLVRSLCFVLFPGSVVLAFSAPSLVEAVLGPNWGVTGTILSILSPTMAAYGLTYAMSDLFISQNRSSELRASGLWDMMFRAGGAMVGVHWGGFGVALGLSIGTVLSLPVRLSQAGRRGPVALSDQLHAILPSLPPALGAAAGCLTCMFFSLNRTSAETASAAIVLSGIVGALVGALLVAKSRETLTSLTQTLVGRHRV